LSNDTEISITLLKKYIHFFQDNCLINTLPYFFTDKKKELSHQETVGIADMGIMSYMTHHYGSKLHNLTSIKNFVANEIIKYIPDTDRCMTYQKVNNSTIDFIILHGDNTITTIIVSESNSDKPPKVLK
jgi:predicted AAA+ superfamily ATPase